MRLFLSLCFLFMLQSTFAIDPGYKIIVELDNFEEKQVYLAYKMGDMQYIKDTVNINADGRFVLTGEEPLKSGVYLLVLPPNNVFFEWMIDKDDQHFTFKADAKDTKKQVTFIGSPTNTLFTEYGQFLAKLRPEANALRQQIAELDSLGNTKKKEKVEQQLDELDQSVKAYQENFLKKNASTLPAAFIKGIQEVDIPEFEGTQDEIRTKQYNYYRNHYFDNIDLADPRMLYTNFVHRKIMTYLDKVIHPDPDTISAEITKLLTKMEPAEETYKYYVIDFLNKYANSKIVGYDAVYVHIVNQYYKTGKTPWIDEDQLEKILRQAALMEPVLIGKKGVDLKLYKEDGTPKSIYDTDKKYTILYFWGPDCGYCKKSAPFLAEFAKSYENKKDIEIFTICTELGEDGKTKCWEGVKEYEFNDMINLADPDFHSRFKIKYNVQTTPMIYILDEHKEIIMKRIPAKELQSVMDQIIEREQNLKE